MTISPKRRTDLLAGPYTRLLAELEEGLGNLYRAFAEAIPSASDFWRRMAVEKDSHRTLVENIEEQFQKGAWHFHRPAFASGAVADCCNRVHTMTEQVYQDGVTMRDALHYALALEKGKIESDFHQIVEADTSETIEIIESMRGFTRAHVRHLQNEAKRLKWFIGGTKKEKRGHLQAHTHTREEIQNSVKVVQAAMIGQLVSLEEAVSCLYKTFSQRLEDCAAYWSDIAAEEVQHAAMIRCLYKVLDEGHVFFNVARFRSRDLLAQIEWVLDLEHAARYEPLSRATAINTALKVEQLLAERQFYRTVKSDAPEFKFVAARMTAHSEEHLKRLEEECARTVDLGEAATVLARPLRGDAAVSSAYAESVSVAGQKSA